jgi:hypothetical protein
MNQFHLYHQYIQGRVDIPKANRAEPSARSNSLNAIVISRISVEDRPSCLLILFPDAISVVCGDVEVVE